MIKLKNVSKYYYGKGVVATGFSKVNLELNLGEFVAITGESGSGKSTLLNVISGLDTYEDGEMYINGEETSHYIEKDFEEYRRKNIGNIYQSFNLINSYTVYQNIALVLMLNGEKDIKNRVIELIKKVDLYKFRNTKVSRLSGGQKQRVAIARALAKDVPIIIADEPTGNLDKRSALSVMKLLSELSHDKLVIVVTHNYDQVAPYVTRKITMHDGKILEDVKVKDIDNKATYKPSKLNTLSIFNRFRLGFRNTFNIIPKFVLLLLVFSFIVGALMSEYSSFRKEETQSKEEASNVVFKNKSVNRIVLKKKDKSVITDNDLEVLRKLDNVDYVVDNDLLLDTELGLRDEDDNYWVRTFIMPYINFKNTVDVGRLPENDNEILLEMNEDCYYFSYERDKMLEKEWFFVNDYNETAANNKKLKIVGISYNNHLNYDDIYSYVGDTLQKELKVEIHKQFSDVVINFYGKNHKVDRYSTAFQLTPSDRVPVGQAYIPERYSYLCYKNDCLWSTFDVTNNNLYYKDTKTFTISRTYNKKNITSMVDIPDYKKDNFEFQYDGKIYINTQDFLSLFDKENYQASVFVKDKELVHDTALNINKLGYETLEIKDTLVELGFAQYIRIIKLIITIALVVTLFFISYFIIKIILKSRNTYYSIIRMLGGTKNITTELLVIELMLVANIAYFIFMIFVYINHMGMINVKLFTDIYEVFKVNDYIILYLIVVGMAFVSSMRYSRKLFKDSVMKSFKEEV
ncbi:MAG: ABC transporter ATP-binding protein [Bacilli bacterium]|nr:ABC transporter ATP-binding protein [Bacilli bacterium]